MRGRNRKGPNPLSRSYESNGPDVKIRGTALHIAEKYVTLARDAASSGDRVAEQNYLQHAEHYYRIVAAAQAQMPQPQPFQRADDNDDGDEGQPVRFGDRQGGYNGETHHAHGGQDAQPHYNGDANGHGDDGDDDAGDDDNEMGTVRAMNEGGQRSRPRNRRQPRAQAPRAEEPAEEEALATGSDD